MQSPLEDSAEKSAVNPALLPKLPPLVKMDVSAEGRRRSDQKKLYYQANKERIRARHAEYRKVNKDHTSASRKAFRERNRDRTNVQARISRLLNPDREKAKHQRNYLRNPELYRRRRRDYYHRNIEKERAKIRAYGHKNRKKINAQRKAREAVDIEYAIGERLRRQLVKAVLRRNTAKADSTMNLLGCPLPDFIKHLESQFVDGMGWHNRDRWEIDHIKPIASFTLTNPDHQRECFHWTNLRPLWTELNRKKSDKLDYDKT